MGKITGLVFEDAPAYTCPHCGRAYRSAEALERHRLERHRKDKHSEPADDGPDDDAKE